MPIHIVDIAAEFVLITVFDAYSESAPKGVFSLCRGLAKDRFQLGEDRLDGIEVQAGGRQQRTDAPAPSI